jgi:chaperonin cofactor prefoldin
MEDDYTLLGSKEVSELKQDIEYLKKNPLGGTKEGKSLLEEIQKLNENISSLIEIFKEAGEMVKAEEREADVIVKRIEPIEARLDTLAAQNEKIAKGILAVADMVSEKESSKPMMEKPMMQPSFPPLSPLPPRPMQRPMQPKLPPLGSIPVTQSMPPPPMPKEKKGLFGIKLKK